MTPSNIALILPLVDAQRSQKTGSKAANLSKLIGARFAVPRGFVISADAYRSHLWASGARFVASEAEDAENREKVRNAILAGEIPEDIWTNIAEAYQRLSWQVGYSDPRVAVRSSSIEGADCPGFSGAYESYLNVSGLDALRAAVKRVWASLWTGKAAAYRTRHQLSTEPAMAVIVQQMVDAPWFGSVLTADPVTGNPHQVLVSCSQRAECSQITQYRVDLHSFDITSSADSDCGLDTQAVALVAERAIMVENSFSSRVQLDWAYDGRMLWMLQADPLVDLACYYPAEVDDSARWTCETTHPLSPLARSILWESPRAVSKPYPTRRDIDQARLINGRVYRCVSDQTGDSGWTRDAAAAEKLHAQWEREIRPDLRAQSAETMSVDLSALDNSKLRRRLLQMVEVVRQAADWLDWSRYPSTRFVGLLQDMLRERGDDDPLFFRLLGGLADETVKRDARLRDLGERFAVAEAEDKLGDEKWWRDYKAEVQSFAAEYGYSFTCRPESWDLSTWESWVQNTDGVFRMIAALTRQDSRRTILTRHSAAEQEARDAEAETAKMFRGADKRRFELLLRLSRFWIATGNNAEHVYALACSALKRVLDEAAGRALSAGAIADKTDIYYLTVEELVGLLHNGGSAGRESVRSALVRRKHEIWLEDRLKAPTCLGEVVSHESGLGCPGVAVGAARVARTLAEAGEIEPGEILVVAEPCLAWTPFLAVAGGLVTESQADPQGAAVARSYGVPAVFGCSGAMAAAETSRRVVVNGDACAVEFKN